MPPSAGPATRPSPSDAGDAATRALCGLIGSIGRSDFATAALAEINACVVAGWWSVYRLFDDAPPEMHVTASLGVPDGTMRSWQAYRASLYRHDGSFDAAREALGGRPASFVPVHVHANQMPTRQRAAIYSRHGIRERLSVATRPAGGRALLALNLYRHESQSPYRDRDVDALLRLGPPLLACVERHAALAGDAPAGTAAPAAATDPLAGLTPREREVCRRLLKGWTHDGIAADLGLAATTVKTYRDRAFDRLGIHHRNELFALALASAAP